MALILKPRSAGPAAGTLPGPLRLDAGSAVIGRANGVDLLLPHPLVSSRHCVVTGQAGSWQVQDTSTNGTLVNGARVAGAQPLKNGDVIGLADIELEVTIEAPATASTARRSGARDDWGRAGGAQAAPAPESWTPTRAAPAGDDLNKPTQAAGLAGGHQPAATADVALRAAVTGLTKLAQARSKARCDLRLADPAGRHNPILSDDPSALAKLMAMPPAGAADAIGAACRELEAHQRASFGALQAAFKAALDQFAPAAIKLRARDDASSWKVYEKAFQADDGFVEQFAQEFAKAYDRLSRP